MSIRGTSLTVQKKKSNADAKTEDHLLRLREDSARNPTPTGRIAKKGKEKSNADAKIYIEHF